MRLIIINIFTTKIIKNIINFDIFMYICLYTYNLILINILIYKEFINVI
jgi:hypothetical protein